VSLLVGLAAARGDAQGQGRRFGLMPQRRANPPYDGAFTFCRIMFRNQPAGDGGGWSVDYPRADINLSFRLSELTTTAVSRGAGGSFNHVLLRLTDPELFHCPFVMMTEPGGAFLDQEEAARLHDYLLKGGFLWADDFWGEYAWNIWRGEISKALPPAQYPVIDLPLTHPIFHMLYEVKRLPQVPSINFWAGSGGHTSERGADSAEPHARAIVDADGRVMVLMTHNTDFGDAFERENDNREYFERFASDGYAFGINALLYALTH
jgi:hypothetical protein